MVVGPQDLKQESIHTRCADMNSGAYTVQKAWVRHTCWGDLVEIRAGDLVKSACISMRTYSAWDPSKISTLNFAAMSGPLELLSTNKGSSTRAPQ